MAEPKKISSGKVHVDFAEPTDPTSVHVLWNLPIGSLVTSVVVNYVTAACATFFAVRFDKPIPLPDGVRPPQNWGRYHVREEEPQP